MNFCEGIICSPLYFNEDLECAAIFAVAMKFVFDCTICDLLFLICATLYN